MPVRTIRSLTNNKSETDRLTVYYLIILFSIVAGVAYLKIRNLFLLGYTSDLFMFDNVIKNTLSGRFGVEYTYGNQFGEQAYFILLLLVPLKMLLSDKMTVFLILFGTIFYFFSGMAIFFYLRTCLVIREAFFISVSYLFLFGMTFRGLFESIYGFHPDIIAGFCLLIYAVTEIQRQKKIVAGKDTKYHTIILSVIYILFISIKQEMALVAAIFFLSLFFFSKNRSYLLMACLSFLFFILGMIFVSLSYTEFNRGNWVLIESLIKALQKDKFQFFLQARLINFYLYLFVISIPFLLSCFIARSYDNNYSHFSLSIFISAIIKSFFAFISNDFSLLTWHNFPCVEMIAGATALQFAAWGTLDNCKKRVCISIFLLFSVLSFLLIDFVFYKDKIRFHKQLDEIVSEVEQSMIAAKKSVPEKNIVAIPLMTARLWADCNYTFYPRGIYTSPKGIADYIVIPKENTGIPISFFNLKYQKKNEIDKFIKDFSLIGENKYFLIFQRIYIQPDHKESRDRFFRLFHPL